jgi:hypothetical protein
MIKATVTKSGFNVDRIMDDVKKKTFRHVLEKAKDKARFLRCEEHGQSATITHHESGDDSALNISRCCEAFRKKATDLVLNK